MSRQLLGRDVLVPIPESALGLRDPDPEAVYHIRIITSDIARELSGRHTKRVPNPRTQRMEDETDFAGLQEAFLDHVIGDWTGVHDQGQPAPCDLAHKRKLPIDVQVALIERARMGVPTADAQAASFRGTQGLLRVVGGSTAAEALLPVRRSDDAG